MATFVFDTKWADTLSEFSAEVRLEVYEAIIRYASSGTLSELKPLARMAFGFVRLQIDEQAARMRPEPSCGLSMPLCEMETVCANGKEREKEKENFPAPLSKEKEKEKENGSDADASLSTFSDEKDDSALGGARTCERPLVDWRQLAAYFNERMAGKPVPRLSIMSQRRRAAVRARMAECGGLEAVRLVIDKAAASDFLCGGNSRGFVADFDWLMRPANFAKVHDGNYDNRRKTAPADGGTTLRPGEMEYGEGGW